MRLEEEVTLAPESQTWVKVKTQTPGLITIEPYAPLYHKTQCSVGTGVHQSEQGKHFRVFLANFSPEFVKLKKDQIIGVTGEHPSAVMEADISHAEMLGIADANTKYRKRDHNARDVNLINKNLAEAREAALKENDKVPVTAATVELSLTEGKEDKIRAMLKQHEELWSRKLGEISATKHSIRLIEGARPSKSAPYRAGPKTRELEKKEVFRQLEAGAVS